IIQGIETDARGLLWLATSRGLVRLNPETLTWRHFTTADGLADNEFTRTSSAVLPTGKLVFGTISGQVVVDPRAILTDTYDPPLVLTALKINNVPSEANLLDSPLTAPINALTELVLDHTQNFLTVAFAGLHYARTDKIQYRYQLVGVDEKWVNSGTQQVANYTQLAPGTYQLIVNCTRADGQWSQRTKQLQIRIIPPFWATWWAYGAYALGFAGLAFGYVRFRAGQLQQKQEIIRKRLEAEQLRAVDEVKTRFFANITHEFRTPLSLILLPVEKLMLQEKHDSDTQRTLTLIQKNAQQLLRLINQLLDLSKIDENSMGVSLARGDGVDFVQSCVDLFRPVADVKRIDLQLHTNGLVGEWLFDTDKWEKIISNLLSNALKFTPVGGRITVTIQLPESGLLIIQVADTGIGITAESLPHIFDRFYQVDDSRTRAYEGTGIGLALVNELTSLLGGTITVESRTEAPSGTTFTLCLPVAPVSETAEALRASGLAVAMPTAPSDLPPVAVRDSLPETVPLLAIIEDNEELRTFIAAELGSVYRVITAADGEEGWQLIQAELPDVVISDVMMPRMDGYQLTHCIKSTVATNHIAVVLLTAKSAHQSLIKGLQQGADNYLTKPFHMDELYLRLHNLTSHQQALKEYHRKQLTAIETVFSPSEVDDEFLKKVYACIEARLDDSSLTVDELAGAHHMSRRTLHRKLTALTNLSANDLIRQYRLRRATELLRGGHSVAETAYRVGFNNPAYFST
ncbi:MAG: response regulator, partial [Cytophagaceae bacterium]